ncbi:MAG: response regulator transcription factor [Alphaproteobacteria bacterium]|nr:response regulator transcription factor [Alphaproteobacteria bacterium]
MISPRIIVVEDDEALRQTICKFLVKTGMDVRGCNDAESLHAAFAEQPADLVVLDVNLPGENGFAAAAKLRAVSAAGIILLTARSDVDDRVLGLTSGADAYLTKPLHLRELHAAITNLLWRMTVDGSPRPVEPEALPWVLNRRGWYLVSPTGRRIELTASEFRFLSLLAACPGQPLARDAILSGQGKSADINDGRSIDILLSRLRRKVSEETGLPLPIKTVRASGYAFAAAVIVRE